MAEDPRDREDPFQVDSSPTETDVETLVFGWCSNCICEPYYHLGTSDTAECVTCGCITFFPHPDTEILDTITNYLLPESTEELPESLKIYEPEFREVNITLTKEDIVVHNFNEPAVTYNSVVFLGKASRTCKHCGEMKLYREFGGSSDPDKLCGLCADWTAQDEVLEPLTDYERAELEELERDIDDAEEEYEDAWDRQRMIDDVLRELDG